jgi:hypothetical protein
MLNSGKPELRWEKVARMKSAPDEGFYPSGNPLTEPNV